nr:ribonuclease H-like domain-containing protein [Tanacetum cinerariifolium]
MLADSLLPIPFWAEVVNTACYVQNRVLVTKPYNKTPYELLLGRTPSIGFMRSFGCHVTMLNTLDPLGPKEANHSAGTKANDDQDANLKEIDLNGEHFVLPVWSAYSTPIKSSGDKIRKNEKPISPVKQIFQEELEKLKRKEKEANDAAKKEATHETQDVNTDSTNLLNAISIPVSVVGPLRALNDDEPSYPDDPSMPHLEDIYASPSAWIFTNSSYDDEGVSSGDKIEKNTNFNTCEKPVSQVEQIFLEVLEKLKRQEQEASDAAESLRKEATHDTQNANTSSINLLNTVSTPLSTTGPSRAFNDGELSYPDNPSMPHLGDIYASPSEGILLIHLMMMKVW